MERGRENVARGAGYQEIGIDRGGGRVYFCGMKKFGLRVTFLWVMIMAGFAIHSIADLMPLFWGVDVAISDVGATPVGMLVFMMAMTYLLPVVGMLCVLFSSRRLWLTVNAVLAVLTAVFCVFHMSELYAGFNPVQVVILPVMAVVGVLLAIDSISLLKSAGQEDAK